MKNILDTIGNTRLVRLKNIGNGNIYVKVEKEEEIIKVPCKFRYKEEGILPLDPFERASHQYNLIEVIDDE